MGPPAAFKKGPPALTRPTLSRVLEQLTQATLDQNEVRPKDVLDKRTPADVFQNEPRANVDRNALYFEWDQLREGILKRNPPEPSRQSAAERRCAWLLS